MSITVPLEGFGGGGAALNFDVKAYATEELLLAATPKGNTIGIITTTAINGWAFFATEPTEPAQGMVWITVGTSSPVEFNALKKNAIQVYPISAKQYVSGAWVDVTAMSYQDGVWVEWIRYILKGNNLYEGWTAAGSTQTMTSATNGMLVKRNGAHCAHNSNVAYDISNYSAVYLEYSELTNLVGIEVFVNTVKHVSGSTTPLATAQSPLGSVSTSGTVMIDLSGVKNQGKMYIAFAVYGNTTGSALVESIWFE